MATEPIEPCHAITVGILGFDVPTIVKCGLIEGHDGPHHTELTWERQDIETIARYFPDREVTLDRDEHAAHVVDVLMGPR